MILHQLRVGLKLLSRGTAGSIATTNGGQGKLQSLPETLGKSSGVVPCEVLGTNFTALLDMIKQSAYKNA